MTTVNELRQAIETKYLEPATELTPSTPLATTIDDSATTIVLTAGVLSPDEESYLGPGREVELDNERIQIVDYDPNSSTITDCVRGAFGSTAAAHTATTCSVRFPTRWPRSTIIASIRAAIESLWQPLAVPLTTEATVETAQYLELPLSTVRVSNVEYLDDNLEPHRIAHRFIPVSPTNKSAAAVQLGPIPYQGALCVVSYSVQIEAPTSNDTDIEHLPEKWERIIMADVAADLLSGVDIDAVTQENLTESLRLDRFPVKSGSSVSQNLIRYREYLVGLAEKEIKAANPRSVHRRVLSLWG